MFPRTIDPAGRQNGSSPLSDPCVDVSVADLLATVANQEVMRVGGPAWADPISTSLS